MTLGLLRSKFRCTNRVLNILLAAVLLWPVAPDRGLCAAPTDTPSQNASAREYYQRGLKLFLEHQPAQATVELQHSLKLNPDQPKVLKLIGLCYQLTNDVGLAEEAFHRAGELSPKDSEAWFFLGRLYYDQNFFDRALRDFKTALRLNARDYRVHNYLGQTFEASGQPADALREYRAAIRWNEKRARPSFSPYLNYGMLLSKLSRWTESEKQLQRAQQIAPEIWDSYFELGRIYYRQRKWTMAVRQLRAALKAGSIKPAQKARVYNLLARVFFEMGHNQEAEKALQMRKKYAP